MSRSSTNRWNDCRLSRRNNSWISFAQNASNHSWKSRSGGSCGRKNGGNPTWRSRRPSYRIPNASWSSCVIGVSHTTALRPASVSRNLADAPGSRIRWRRCALADDDRRRSSAAPRNDRAGGFRPVRYACPQGHRETPSDPRAGAGPAATRSRSTPHSEDSGKWSSCRRAGRPGARRSIGDAKRFRCAGSSEASASCRLGGIKCDQTQH